MRGAKEVLRDRRDLSTIADGNGTVIAMSIVVARLLVVLELDARQSEPERPHKRGYYTLFMSGNRST